MTLLQQIADPLEMSARDVADIAALREAPKMPNHGSLVAAETDQELMLRVMRAGVEKIREERAAAAYSSLADDPEYRDYHARRRVGRRARD